jgi:hypothetical protein
MIPTAQVFWSVTGRFYGSGTTVVDVGYFLLLNPIPFTQMFSDPTAPSETTAYFTFAAVPFTAIPVSNGGLGVGVDETGTFTLYYNQSPGSADFNKPLTFGTGLPIATFQRTNIVVGVTAGNPAPLSSISSNLFSAQLVTGSTTPFTIGGVTYDLAELVPNGITQMGFAATTNLVAPSGYSVTVPFVGTSIAQGT